MTRFVLLSLALALGFAIGYGFHALDSGKAPAANVLPTIEAAGSPLSSQEVESHRRAHFEDIDGMAQILALPTRFAQNEALYVLAGRADVGALDRLIAEATAVRDDALRRLSLVVFFGRYAELATPPEAMQAALRLDDADLRQMAVHAIAEAWAHVAPARAYAYGMDIDDLHLQSAFIGVVISRWAETEPDVALQQLSKDQHSMRTVMYVQEAMSGLAARDPQRAFDLAGRLDSAALRLSAQQTAILTWAQTDAEAAIRQVEALPQSPDRRELEQLLAEQYARKDPDKAIAWAQRAPGPAGTQLLFAVLHGIAQEDPQRAVDAAATLETSALQRQALSSVISYLAWEKPEAAALYIDRLPAGTERIDAVDDLASAWAEQDPDRASAWAAGLDEPLRSNAALSLGRHLAYNDPERATAIVDLLEGAARAELIHNIASGFSESDPEQAQAWISQFEGEPNYSRLVSAVAQGTATQDPQAGLDLVARIDDSDERNSAISAVVYTWASTDPVEASAYVDRLSTTSTKLAAVDGIVSGWADHDPAAAHAWAAGLKPDEVRDRALLTLVTQTSPSLDDYVAIISDMRSDTQRSDTIQQAVQSLAYRDRDAARRLLDRLPASTEQKEALQRFLDDPSNFVSY